MRSPLHVRFLNLINALRQMAPFDDMTAEERALLDDLVVRWDKQQRLTVGQMMSESGRSSGITVYRRLTSLRDKGLIELRTCETDKRARIIEPTPLSRHYVSLLQSQLAAVFEQEHAS